MDQLKGKLGPASVALAAMLWGSIGLFVQSVNLPSLTITFFRVMFAAVSILLIVWLTTGMKSLKLQSKQQYKRAALMSFFYTGNWILFFQALKMTSVTNAVLAYYTAPAFMAILGLFVLKEKLDLKAILFILVAFFGLYLLFTPEGGTGNNDGLGLFYAVVAGFLYASAVVTAKPLTGALSSWVIAAYQTGVATILLLPWFVYQVIVGANPYPADLNEFWMLLTLGLLNTTVAFGLFFFGINYMSAKSVGLVTYLEPMGAVFMAALLLTQPLHTSTIVGGGMIILSGIFGIITEKGGKKNKSQVAHAAN